MPNRQDQMAALDQVLSQAQPPGGADAPMPAEGGPEEGMGTVVCDVCGTEVDTESGEPVTEPELPSGGEEAPALPPLGGGGGMPMGGAMPAGPMQRQ